MQDITMVGTGIMSVISMFFASTWGIGLVFLCVGLLWGIVCLKLVIDKICTKITWKNAQE